VLGAGENGTIDLGGENSRVEFIDCYSNVIISNLICVTLLYIPKGKSRFMR
jgi:hypothetical protein